LASNYSKFEIERTGHFLTTSAAKDCFVLMIKRGLPCPVMARSSRKPIGGRDPMRKFPEETSAGSRRQKGGVDRRTVSRTISGPLKDGIPSGSPMSGMAGARDWVVSFEVLWKAL
jgi:hypothetical protein